MLELADRADSNSAVREDMWVRVPPAVPGNHSTELRCVVSGAPSPCVDPMVLDSTYGYLLGLYLGDGSLSLGPRAVWRLRITLDAKYPDVIKRASSAIDHVRGRRPGITMRQGCVDVSSYWKHWVCCFPQHGGGAKHTRDVRLQPWQQSIVNSSPDAFLAGLIHSDGCRCLNRVKGRAYPRYFFSNRSPHVRAMFAATCALVGVDCRPAGQRNISVARRDSVALLDWLIAPKG